MKLLGLGAALLLGMAVAAPFTMEVRGFSGDERFKLSGDLPNGYRADPVFRKIGGKTEIDVSVANSFLSFDISGPRKVLRQDKTGAARAVIYEVGAGNTNFSNKYHVGVVVASPTLKGKYVFCKGSSNEIALINEVIAICKGFKLSK